jgi:hypothetical protein
MRTESELNSNVELRPCDPHPYATGCFATKNFKAGDVIIASVSTGEVSSVDTFESLQVREGKHMQMSKPAVNLNHSCNPNGYICFDTFEYKALVDIKQVTVLTLY